MTNSINISFVRLPSVKGQLGFSLIELLVAMVIGLFLLLGMTTSYLSSKISSMNRDQISILETNGRAALGVLTNTLQHAGYRSTGIIALKTPFMSDGRPTSYSCGVGINSVLSPANFPNTVISDSDSAGDSLGVIYLGDSHLNTDCSGGVLPPACRVEANVDARAYLIYNAFFIGANDTLRCVGSRTTDEVTIAEGVENIQVLYGMDIDNDVSKNVDRYVDATAVNGDWEKVVSIQIAILARTLVEIKPNPESQSFTLLNTKVVTPKDRFQRAAFSTSIQLRNL